jgi:hypothetical protein
MKTVSIPKREIASGSQKNAKTDERGSAGAISARTASEKADILARREC